MLSFSHIFGLRQVLLFSLLTALPITGCSSARKDTRPVAGVERTQTTREMMGPPAPPVGVREAGAAHPAETKTGSGKIALAFGPGFSKGYAASGVLRKLAEWNVPISRIYAHEVSALVSAIHAISPNVNRVDWALLKFNDLQLARDKPHAFTLTAGPESKIEERLRELFADRRIETLRPPLRIANYSENSASLQWVADGEIRTAVRAALGGANLGLRAMKKSSQIYGRGEHLKGFVKEIDSKESDPVVYVFFSPPTSEEGEAIERTGAAKIIIPLAEVPETDFKKKNFAIFQGKEAIERQKSLIYRLIGRSDDSSETETSSSSLQGK